MDMPSTWSGSGKLKISRKEEMMDRNAHGSPYDRGSADAYYGRQKNPHWWPCGTGNGKMIPEEKMNDVQIEEYHKGYDNEPERKYSYSDWEVNAQGGIVKVWVVSYCYMLRELRQKVQVFSTSEAANKFSKFLEKENYQWVVVSEQEIQ